jgi:hypothetical protein
MKATIVVSLAIAMFLWLISIVSRTKCQEHGCHKRGVACFLPGDDKDHPSHRYCEKHAAENGFCWGCGGFCAGIEAFDFGDGLCENCREDNDEEYYEDALDEQDYF